MRLVGFILRIYHDARSPERLYSKNKFEKLVYLVGFIIRICHDARSPERQFATMHVHLNVKFTSMSMQPLVTQFKISRIFFLLNLNV